MLPRRTIRRAQPNAPLSEKASAGGRVRALFLLAVLCIRGGALPRVAAAATDGGQAQASNSQTANGSRSGYPPNSRTKEYSKEEEKEIGRVMSAFGKYSSACVELFKPALIGLKGGVSAPVDVTETLRLKGGENLLDANSLSGAIAEGSILLSQPDAELTEWQRQIKREVTKPLPDYWKMSPWDLAEAAKESEKNFVEDETKAASHPGNKDAPAHLLYSFLFARQLCVIRLAELWQQSFTQRDPRLLDYIQSLLRDGKPPTIAHMPQEIPDNGVPLAFVLFTPSPDVVMDMSSLDASVRSKPSKKNRGRQRSSAIRIEVVIATRKGNSFEFVRSYLYKRVADGYSPTDGPPLADPSFADYRWIMLPSADDQVTWSAGTVSIKKNDTFPFQDDMVVRLAPENSYLARNYVNGGPLGPALPDEPRVPLSELMEQAAARKLPSPVPSLAVRAAKENDPAPGTPPPMNQPVASVPTAGQPVSSAPPSAPAKPASGIRPMFTTDSLFTIPGTNPIGNGLIDHATENVNKAIQWLNPLILDAKGPWAELLDYQPRNVADGIIGIHFSVSPPPPSARPVPQLIMSKSTTSLSIGIPAEHYHDPGAIFEDLLELFVWNLPVQDRARHDELVQQIRKSAGEFHYPVEPLPPEVLAKLGVGTASQAKSLDADTPDTGTSTGIYDGDIQGHVIGSTVKCFNLLLGKGGPYLTRVQNLALWKAKESSEAGDAEATRRWQRMAATLGEDIRALDALLESLPPQLKVDFYIRPAEQTTARGKLAKPPKIPESELGVRLSIALAKEDYERGPASVKDALIQQLSDETGRGQVRRAVEHFFLVFAQDPANKGSYFAVTMQQLNPQPDGELEQVPKLWPPRAIE